MALESINVGILANDGTGDDLRDAFIKINQNFQALEYLDNLRGNNLGSAGAEVFASFENGQLNFRRIIGSDDIIVEELENTIKIDANIPPRTLVFSSESGSIVIENNGILNFQGDSSILIEGNSNTSTLNFSLRGDVSKYLSFDFGTNFGVNKTSILDFVISTIGIDFGTFSDPSPYIVDIGEL